MTSRRVVRRDGVPELRCGFIPDSAAHLRAGVAAGVPDDASNSGDRGDQPTGLVNPVGGQCRQICVDLRVGDCRCGGPGRGDHCDIDGVGNRGDAGGETVRSDAGLDVVGGRDRDRVRSDLRGVSRRGQSRSGGWRQWIGEGGRRDQRSKQHSDRGDRGDLDLAQGRCLSVGRRPTCASMR